MHTCSFIICTYMYIYSHLTKMLSTDMYFLGFVVIWNYISAILNLKAGYSQSSKSLKSAVERYWKLNLWPLELQAKHLATTLCQHSYQLTLWHKQICSENIKAVNSAYLWLIFEVILHRHHIALADNLTQGDTCIKVTLKHFLQMNKIIWWFFIK